MEDMELELSTSEGEPSSSEDQEDDLDITNSDGAKSVEPIVAGPSDGGGQVSNVASASNASNLSKSIENNVSAACKHEKTMF